MCHLEDLHKRVLEGPPEQGDVGLSFWSTISSPYLLSTSEFLNISLGKLNF